jgi:NADH dehydrogenase FAD-containing subunit
MTASTSGLKKLVLIGAGFGHLQALRELATNRPADLTVTLVTPVLRPLYAAMLPGFIVGEYAREDMVLPLDEVIERSGARLVQGTCTGLDAAARTVTLSDGQVLPFTVLGLNTGTPYDRDAIEHDMPGAREHALLLRPFETFVQLWPHVAGMAQERAIHVAVIGGGATGVEMALATAHRITRPCGSRVTLVTGGPEPMANYPERVRARVAALLRRRGITVLRERCVGFQPGEVLLSNGARLVSDAPVVAIGGQPPAWLRDSGLALDEAGRVVVNAHQQSTSHLRVFAAGDVCSRVDRTDPHDGVFALRAGPVLAANLRAALYEKPLQAHNPKPRALNLLVSGGRKALATWGPWCAGGAWAWYWKDRLDRRFVRDFGVA